MTKAKEPAFVSDPMEDLKPGELASQAWTKRFGAIEREVDKFGRVIGAKPLTPSQQMAIVGMTSDLTGVTPGVDDEGNEFQIPDRAPFMIAAAVREIDGNPVTFPRNRAELNAVFDKLMNEGIEAAANALGRILPKEGGVEAAKN